MARMLSSARSAHQYHSITLSRPLFSYSYAPFCTAQSDKSYLFMGFRTLCTKHPGWGAATFPRLCCVAHTRTPCNSNLCMGLLHTSLYTRGWGSKLGRGLRSACFEDSLPGDRRRSRGILNLRQRQLAASRHHVPPARIPHESRHTLVVQDSPEPSIRSAVGSRYGSAPGFHGIKFTFTLSAAPTVSPPAAHLPAHHLLRPASRTRTSGVPTAAADISCTPQQRRIGYFRLIGISASRCSSFDAFNEIASFGRTFPAPAAQSREQSRSWKASRASGKSPAFHIQQNPQRPHHRIEI